MNTDKRDDTCDRPTLAEVYYIAKDPRHEIEKPYSLYYDPDDGIPRTNVTNEARLIEIHNARSIGRNITYKDFGFAALSFRSALLSDDFYQRDIVVDVYYGECKKLLRTLFPDADKIEILEHLTRKRHQTFPVATGQDYEHSQPSTLVHIDYTAQSAERSGSIAFNLEPNQYSRLVTVNLWKPIKGPIYDWPLAMCDPRTVDHGVETVGQDLVEREFFNENARVYYSKNHEWYYYPGLQQDEMLIFRQSDSSLEGGGGVPHVAIPEPKVNEEMKPRESIEARAFVYFV